MLKKNLDILWKLEREFIIYQKTYDIALQIEQDLRQVFDECIRKQSIVMLKELQESIGQYSGCMTNQIYYMKLLLDLFLLEDREAEKLSWWDVVSYDEMEQKYKLTVMSLRRIELELSSEFSRVGEEYLIKIDAKPYYLRYILEKEMLELRSSLFWNVYNLMASKWSEIEKIRWLLYMNEKFPSKKGYLSIALNYATIGKFQEAVNWLEKIEKPSEKEKEVLAKMTRRLHE